jgi:hypothetical protein
VISRTDRLVPVAEGALPLVIGLSRVGDGDGVGLTLGLGDPAVSSGVIPSCGCDACDTGSQEELDRVHDHVLGVVTGQFRRLTRGEEQVTIVRKKQRWQDRDTTGWDELRGEAWLEPGVDGLGFQGEDAEDALVDLVEGAAGDEALQRLQAQGELALGE